MAAVQHEHTPHATPHPAPELEWYVGIAGSPIGPVRVNVIRERAAAGEVDGESLVWREGLSEWRPLRTFPELLEVVTAAQAPRAAPTPTPLVAVPAAVTPATSAPVAPTPTPAPLAAAPAPAPLAAAAASAPPAAAPAPLAAAPAPVTPAPAPAPVVSPAAATSPRGVGDPFAAPSPFGAGAGPSPQNGKVNGFHAANGVDAAALSAGHDAPASAARGPFALGETPKPSTEALKPSTAASAAGASRPSVDIDPALEEALIPRRRGGIHPMAYAFIAAAAVFGGVAALVLLKPPAQPQVVYVQTPGVGAVPTATASASAVEAQAEPQVEVGDLTTSSARPVARVGGPMPKASATASTPAAPIDTSGFVSNVPGPAATGPSTPTAGGQLSQGEMNGVVSQNQPRVRRKCWQPALDGQPPNGPRNARVTVSITINASGSVDSASASGSERDFPGLASCIAGMVKGWKFPASGGSTTVNVPFVFAGQ
jgi:hypothetical protein